MTLTKMGNHKKNVFVKTPSVHYYDEEIQQCQEMYSRLELDRSYDLPSKVQTSHLPFLRSRTMITQSRPVTYKLKQRAGGGSGGGINSHRPISIRSAPAMTLHIDQEDVLVKDERDHTDPSDAVSQSTDCELDPDGHGRKRSKMDPEMLAEYLNQKGLGLPNLVRSSHTYRRISQVIPRGWKSMPLPKNPSSREKIKGRARLDQEMANMKALAFCEQQAPKVFRTASANMRNRDVQFMEEELRDNIQKEVDGDVIDFEDDNASIVMMPFKQEELFLRINTWIDEVESACKSHHHHHHHNHQKDGEQNGHHDKVDKFAMYE